MDPIIIELQSRTVFWEDIGLPKRLSEYQRNKLADWWDNDVEPWMKLAIKGDCNPHEAGVWFAERHDAVLFQVRWNGQGPDV